MRFLDWFIGSDTHLTRPCFANAPRINLNYSGFVLTLADAPHSASTPLVTTIESLDLHDPSRFGPDHNGDYTVLFYSRSWELWGRGSQSAGEVSVTGRILNFPEFQGKRSCFQKEDYEAELLRFCQDVWGWQNEGANLEKRSAGQQIYLYPRKPEDLEYREISEKTWCMFTSQQKGQPPRVDFAIPITPEHILVFDFTLLAFGGRDFYSPETNLKETSFQIVEDFMSHVRVTLSPEAEAARCASIKR